MKRGRRPVVITDAHQSPRDELRYRERRYVLMMSIRALCLVAAAVLVSAHAPLLWLWLPLCLFGMVVIPWLAVILANEDPAAFAEYLAEAREWDALAADGLGDAREEFPEYNS